MNQVVGGMGDLVKVLFEYQAIKSRGEGEKLTLNYEEGEGEGQGKRDM